MNRLASCISRIAVFLLLGLSVSGTPAGATLAWRRLAASPMNTFRHDDVCFVNSQVGWVVNTSGFIYKTTDGGTSWTTLVESPTSTFRCVGFANESKGWVGNLTIDLNCFGTPGDPVLLYATTDGGTTWTPVTGLPEPLPLGLCGMDVVDEDVVYIVGRVCDPARIVKTTDGGATWESIDMVGLADRLIDCLFVDAQTGFVVGGRDDVVSGNSRGVILQTTDGGVTWTTRHETAAENRWCWKITAPSANVMYVSVQINDGTTPYVLKSTDAGLTWVQKSLPVASYFEQGIGFATETEGWVGGSTLSYRTTDGGDTWTTFRFEFPTDNVNRVRFLTPTLGYAVGRRVYKYSDDTVVAVPPVAAGDAADRAYLSDVEPNPSRGATTIEYRLPQAGSVRLSVYDVLGRERVVLASGAQGAGPHRVSLQPGQLPAGVYVVRLETGTATEARKFQVVR